MQRALMFCCLAVVLGCWCLVLGKGEARPAQAAKATVSVNQPVNAKNVAPDDEYTDLKNEYYAVVEQIKQIQDQGGDYSAQKMRASEIYQTIFTPRRGDSNLDDGGETCATATVISSLPYTDCGSTAGATDDYTFPSGCMFLNLGSADKVYVITIAPENDVPVTASLLGSGYDTGLAIYNACPDAGGVALACNDDYSGAISLQSCVSLTLTAGTYYIIVDGFGGNVGNYVLNVTTDGVCHDDLCPVECTELPVADLCENAISLPVPSTYIGSTAGATISGPEQGDCGTYMGPQYDVWFEVVGNGNILTAETCGPCTNFDTRMQVWLDCDDDCLDMICVGGNDDAGCGFAGFSGSRFTWCSVVGQLYKIRIAGYYGDAGRFELDILDGNPCTGVEDIVYCNPVGRCCFEELIDNPACADLTEAECFNLGGNWDANLSCEDAPCPVDCHCGGEWCNYDGGSITDFNLLSTTVDVTVEYHITDVNLCLDLTHSYLGDLQIALFSPSGTLILLWSNQCGSDDNMPCVTFDDEAASFLSCPPAGGQSGWPYSGYFSDFDGENAYGTWLLEISDGGLGDIGTLNYWCLNFEYDEILPVSFGSFSAIAGDNAVQLNWNTESETANDFFEILRDGAKVGEADATNSSTGSTYSWVDNNVHNGTTYNYTLVSVDMSGNREELATVQATPNASNATVTEYALLQNYPNPFNPETNITFDLVESGIVTLKIYNVMGQAIVTLVNGSLEAGRHVVNFSGADLPSGLYFYRIEAGSFAAQKKMVLMK